VRLAIYIRQPARGMAQGRLPGTMNYLSRGRGITPILERPPG